MLPVAREATWSLKRQECGSILSVMACSRQLSAGAWYFVRGLTFPIRYTRLQSMTVRLKAGIALVIVVAAAVLMWLWYPEHWLKHVSKFATVTVDDRQVPAEAYLGHPTENEADAFLFVDIGGVGNYIFNFDEESYRPVSRSEFVRLRAGVVTFKPMSKGGWLSPLPFHNINEFRVASSTGHLIVVRF